MRLSLVGSRVVALCLVASLSGAAAWAGKVALTGVGDLTLRLDSAGPLATLEDVVIVKGMVALEPDTPVEGARWAFYVDGLNEYSTTRPNPVYELDTTELADGEHEIRLEAHQGTLADGYRIASTGGIPLIVANAAAPAAVRQGYFPPAASANVLERKHYKRHQVWFNGREGDLEWSARNSGPGMMVTLTDLIRHVGGSVEWGPGKKLLYAHREGTTVKLNPGASTCYVNGVRTDLGAKVALRFGKHWVPVSGMCRVLGVDAIYNSAEKRYYVSY